jgi:hypothetical protein
MAMGGTLSYTWSVAGGALPPGLVLSTDGTLSGTPNGPGTYTFTISVTDSTQPTPEIATNPFTLQVAATFEITTPTLPAGIVGAVYSSTLSATGGATPYSWTVSTGVLPPGLNLTPSGTLAGTPTTAGSYSFTIEATDSAAPNRTASAAFTVQILPPLTITTTNLPDTTVGAIYSAALAATGGNTPYTWSITSGALPAGLSLKPDGTLAGNPSTPGTSTFTVQVADASQPTQSASHSFSVNVTLSLSIVNNALPDGYLNASYALQFSAIGGLAPYTWSATGIPDGLTMTSDGYLSGAPTTTGTFTVKVAVRDAYTPAHNTSKTFALVVRSGLLITTPSLPDGTVNTPYSQVLSGQYGTQPYLWSIASGSLPPGFSFMSDGTLSGTPSVPGGYSFVVQLSDSSVPRLSTTQQFSLTILPGLTIVTTSLPAGAPGTAYSATLQASGGTTPYTWTVAQSSLPPGLILAADGTITGVPTANGTYSVTIQAADSATPQAKATRLFSIAIGPSLAISTASLADARLGVSYRQSLVALNGLQPYYWTLQAGALPPGLILLASGDIVGQPTAIGTYTFTITVSDNTQPPATASQTFTITVAPGFAITTPILPNGTPGSPYQVTLSADHGITPYSWSLVLGALPAGLTLNSKTGIITGTPTKPGVYNLLIRASDSSQPPQTTTAQFTLTIDSTLQVTTAALPDGVTGTPYYQALAATNGILPFMWSLASALPQGLSLLPTGELYGVPTTPGQYNITFAVSDSSQPTAHASRTLSLLISQSLTITTDSVPAGLTSKPYATVISAAGGAPPYRFTAVNPLPAGLTLSSIGTITGTPTASGTSTVTIQVIDAAGISQSRPFVFAIGAVLSITTASLPSSPTGAPYFAHLSASGGDGNYVWTAIGAPLPPGITFLSTIGSFVGTPTQAGQYSIQITLTDGQQAASTTLTVTITTPLSIRPDPLPSAQLSLPYSTTMAATGGVPPYTWSLGSSSTLPSGLTLSNRGVLAGLPTGTAGVSSLSLCVSDSAKPQATRVCAVRSLVVGPAFHIDPTPLANIIPGQPITHVFTESGGQGSVIWTSAFALPTGLTLSTDGTLSGTATTAGKYDLTIIATDSAAEYAVADFDFTVLPPLTVATTVLPAATLGNQYSAGLLATSGQPPYRWSADPNTVPPGFVVDASGIVYGSPTQPGSSNVSVTVTDSSTRPQSATAVVVLTADTPIQVNAGDLPAATAGSLYSEQLTSTGTAPFHWKLVSGQLPSGLLLGDNGIISGTPLAAGDATFIASVLDAHGQFSAAPFALLVNPGLTLGPATTLPAGTVGKEYSYTFTSTFNGPVSWDLVVGALPEGLTLTHTGLLSGTPTAPGTTSFMLEALGGDQRAQQVYTLAVDAPSITPIPAPTIPTASTQLPAADLGQPYSATLVASAGTTPYSWALTQGQLPPGLLLSAVGLLSGAPTQPGTFVFTLTVTDANNQTASALFTIAVRAGLTITTSGPVIAHLNTAINAQLTAAGGTPPYVWSAGGPLPAGIVLSSTGVLSGSATAAGSTTVTITVHDSSSTTQPATAAIQLEIDVTAGLTVTTTTIPAAIRNTAYSAILNAAGGTTPYTWTLNDGQLPPGLALKSDGTLTGTPGALGSYRFAVAVTDATSQTATTSFAVVVTDALIITTPPALSITIAKPANLALAASGGTPPYSWSITSGSLPAGLTLSPGGLLTGTVTAPTAASFTIAVHDSMSVGATQAFTLTASSSIAIITTSLRTGYLGVPYQVALQASGGATPYVWTISAGALPPGLALSNDCLLTGQPGSAGTYPFTVTVTDSAGQQISAPLTCIIASLAITTTSLPAGVVASSYVATLDARGGVAPYSWSSSSAMPAGVSFTSDGVLTGTPTAPFSGSLTFTVTDQANTSASVTLSLTIAAPAAGHLQITGLSAQLMPTVQAPLSVSVDQPAAMDFTGQLILQFAPDTPGRDDATLAFVPANTRTLTFTIPKGTTTAHFQQQPILQAGTSAGTITVSASIATSPNSTGSVTTGIPGLAPVITAAHILSRDTYALTIEIDGYSTTAEVSAAHFTFQGLPAAQSEFNIAVKALFAAWYASQPAANQGGAFQYKQSFNFTGDTNTLSSVSITLTNSMGTTTPYVVAIQ